MIENQNLGNAEPLKFVSRYKDLIVYQKAFSISLEVHRVSLGFPKIEQYGGIADQIRRSSKSICANIAEGYAKQQGSKAEFKRFLLIALGSAEEVFVWIDYVIALGYVEESIGLEWQASYMEVIKMLQSLYSRS